MKTKLAAIAAMVFMSTTSGVYAQDLSPQQPHKVLSASQSLSEADAATIQSLLKHEPTEYDNHVLEANAHKPQAVTKASSDSWNVVRITRVASADYPIWDNMSRYQSITSENHGGNWLLVETEEQAFQPLYGYVGVEAKFRFWNATELVNDRVDISDGIYTSTRRYWVVERSFTSGEFKFEANYASSIGTVRLHRELDIR